MPRQDLSTQRRTLYDIHGTSDLRAGPQRRQTGAKRQGSYGTPRVTQRSKILFDKNRFVTSRQPIRLYRVNLLLPLFMQTEEPGEKTGVLVRPQVGPKGIQAPFHSRVQLSRLML